MSKIFEAYKKKAGEIPDLSLAVGQAGMVSLYPIPSGVQKADFNKLASRLLGLRVENRGLVLGFGSTVPQEGASYVSYNTAVYLAVGYHQRVVWIDGNFNSPQKKLQGHQQKTFSSLLKDPTAVADLVASENPLVIPGGSDLSDNRGLLAGEGYHEVLTQLARRFDYVILDLPSVLGSTDTALMAAGTDGFLLVIEQKNLKLEVIEHGLQGLQEKGTHVLGSVINRRTFDLPKIIYDRL